MNNKCIVLGDNYYNTYGVLRSLGEVGILPSFVNVCKSESWVAKTKYHSDYDQVETYQQGIELISQKFSFEKSKPIIICTSDSGICCLAKNQNVLYGKFHHQHIKSEKYNIVSLLNKQTQCDIAKASGFNVPNCVSISTDKIKEEDIQRINYPCHIKPLNSLNGMKQDMALCLNRIELESELNRLSGKGLSVVVQDYLEKDYEVVLCGCVLKSGEVVIPGSIIKTREWPYRGVTSATKMVKGLLGLDKRLIDKFINTIGFYGIFSMEFIVKDGKYYFLEANFRSDANNYTPTAGGVNIPHMWIRDACGEDTTIMPRTIVKEVHSQVEFVDFDYMKHHPSSLFRWVWDTFRANNYMIYNKQDKEPFRYITRQPFQYRCLSLMYDTLNLFKRNM